MGILAARKETASNSTTTVRQFRVPKLNFEAEDYTELVDWQSIGRYSPPVMKDVSDSEIIIFVESRVTDKVDCPRFPCYPSLWNQLLPSTRSTLLTGVPSASFRSLKTAFFSLGLSHWKRF